MKRSRGKDAGSLAPFTTKRTSSFSLFFFQLSIPFQSTIIKREEPQKDKPFFDENVGEKRSWGKQGFKRKYADYLNVWFAMQVEQSPDFFWPAMKTRARKIIDPRFALSEKEVSELLQNVLTISITGSRSS